MPSEPTHYEVLGVRENATSDEIRRAYRRLVMRLHPDRSGDAKTTDRFVRVNQAYEVLIDPDRRRDYDAVLRIRRQQSSAFNQRSTHTSPTSSKTTRVPYADISARIAEAAGLLAQGKYERAAMVAQAVLRMNYRVAMAHAILGDVARAKQDFRTALKRYSLAIQFDPKNQTFQRQYESLFNQIGELDASGSVKKSAGSTAALWGVALLSGLMMSYVAIAREQPIDTAPQFIQTWTIGLMVMMLVNGIAIGATLALSKVLDRWESVARGTSGRFSTASLLSVVALFNFWLCGFLYLLFGLAQGSFNFSMSRVIGIVALLASSYAVMSALSPYIAWDQTLLWGGNIIFLGVIGGWAVADAFR